MNNDPFDGEDFSFLNEEAAKVKDWPLELQSLVDKGLVKVEYDKDDREQFSLTELGRKVALEIDTDLN